MASPSRLPAARGRPGAAKSRPISMIEGAMLQLDLPKEGGPTSKQPKRRSLLPTLSRKVSNDEREQIKEEVEVDHDTGDIFSVVEVKPGKAMEGADRRAMPPPSKLSRPTSVYGIGGISRAPSVRTHTRKTSGGSDSRADALAALEGTAASKSSTRLTTMDYGLKRTGSTRLPQGSAPRGLSRTTSVRTKEPPGRDRTSGAGTTTTASAVAEKRTSATRSRPASIVEPPSQSKTTHRMRPVSMIEPPSPLKTVHSTIPASPTGSTKPRNRDPRQLPPPSRPAFSTYQQHYSPAKSALPKPPIPSAKATKPLFPAAAEDAPVSFDVAKQQIELLQLSLLHQASQHASREFVASAHRKLEKKHAKLCKDYDMVRVAEQDRRRISNLCALDAWCPDAGLLAEALQVLSKVHAELSVLTEAGGRYARLVAVFEDWIECAETAAVDQPIDFVEALPEDWRKAHASLALGLRGLQRDMEMLPPPPPQHENGRSRLEVLLAWCSSLIDGMLRELEMMRNLEKEMLAREKARVEGEVEALTQDGTLMNGPGKPWVPAWQRAVPI